MQKDRCVVQYRGNKKRLTSLFFHLSIAYISKYLCLKIRLIFQSILLLVEEEVFFGGVVGPDIFDAFVGFAFVFDFLEVFDYFHGGA